jgi:hypothetical protein
MHFLQRFSFGGCLADDMGVGKTAQVLALLESRRELRAAGEPVGPSLVVVPKSLVFNWKEERHASLRSCACSIIPAWSATAMTSPLTTWCSPSTARCAGTPGAASQAGASAVEAMQQIAAGTRDLCRASAAWIGFTTTDKSAVKAIFLKASSCLN